LNWNRDIREVRQIWLIFWRREWCGSIGGAHFSEGGVEHYEAQEGYFRVDR
jgi:hypothetical protein